LSQCTRVTDRQTDGQTDGQTDRRTDRILIARPRLHCMQRGKNHFKDQYKRKEGQQSSSIVTAAKKVCLQPPPRDGQRRSRRNVRWKIVPDTCASDRERSPSDRGPPVGRRQQLVGGRRAKSTSRRHVGNCG